jgi:hypothetical protein
VGTDLAVRGRLGDMVFSWHAQNMDYKIDKVHPDDEGDGLPHMGWRLRVIVAASLGTWAALIAVSLI